MSDFLSFIVVEHIQFLHGALQLHAKVSCKNLSSISMNNNYSTAMLMAYELP